MILGYVTVLSSVQVVNGNDREEDRESIMIKILQLHTVRIFVGLSLCGQGYALSLPYI